MTVKKPRKRVNKIKTKPTERGFSLGTFKDDYGNECSIQKSSIATRDCIWLGINEPTHKLMARDAMSMGREDLLEPGPERYNGWVNWPLPKEVQVASRMHLTRKQVQDLLPLLEHFVKTGELP